MSLIAFKVAGNTGGVSAGSDAAYSGTSGTPIAALQALGSPLLGYNFAPELVSVATNPTTAVAKFFAIEIPVTTTITGIVMILGSSAAGGASSNNKVGLYTANVSTGLTRVAVSADTPTLWTQTAGWVGAAFTTPYVATAGLYYAAYCFTGSVQPTIGARAATYNPALQPVGQTSSNPKLMCQQTDAGGAGVGDLLAGPIAWTSLAFPSGTTPFIGWY
jgi:hypothetical protein